MKGLHILQTTRYMAYCKYQRVCLGVASVNPRAKVYLAWSKTKDYDRNKFLEENDLHYVSDQDIITPNDASRYFGLYKLQDGQA